MQVFSAYVKPVILVLRKSQDMNVNERNCIMCCLL